MNHQVASANLETRTDEPVLSSPTRGILVAATSVFVGLGYVGFMAYMAVQSRNQFEDHKTKIERNLAPNAVYFKSNMVGETDFKVRGLNEDVNRDGTYESVLKFVNPLTGNVESRLIEREGNSIRLRKFEVVNGEINYLPE